MKPTHTHAEVVVLPTLLTEREVKAMTSKKLGAGKAGKVCHKWTDADDVLLPQALERCAELRAHYTRQGYESPVSWWDAVAGALAAIGGPVVTGSACRRRAGVLEDRRVEAAAEADRLAKEAAKVAAPRVVVDPEAAKALGAWDAVWAQVQAQEQEIAEATYDTTQAVRVELAAVRAMVEKLCAAWGVEL